MISPSTSTRIAAITLSLLLFTAEALAGPGFIAETHITRGSVYAEVGIRFRCGVQYLGHDPSAASDVVRIRLETTSVCTGRVAGGQNAAHKFQREDAIRCPAWLG